jgi:hypothetical protein
MYSIPIRLHNAPLVNEEASRSESLSYLEDDLDHVLKLDDEGATACWGPPIFDNYSDPDKKYPRKKSIR